MSHVPAAITGGNPAAAPEQCGAGGVSLEDEAGADARRAGRGACSPSSKLNTKPLMCSNSWISVRFNWTSLCVDESESCSLGTRDRKTH